MIMRILEKDFGGYIDSCSSTSYNEKSTRNLVGTFEDNTCRIELDIKEGQNVFKFFFKKRFAWDTYKLKVAGTGNWKTVGDTLELSFNSNKRKIANKYFIEMYLDQIYLVKTKDYTNFSEMASIRKYADEEMNMLYVKELLNNRFLVKLE